MFFISLYVFPFLPAWLFGVVLTKKTRGFFGLLALVGFLLAASVLASFSGALAYGYGGAIIVLPAFMLIVCAGVVTGTSFRLGSHSETPIRYYASLIVSLLATFGIAVALDYPAFAKKKATQDYIESFWKRDISFDLGEHSITLPVSPRLMVNMSSKRKEGGWNTNHYSFARTKYKGENFFDVMDDPERIIQVNELQVNGVNKVAKDDQRVARSKVHKRWCGLRPEMADKFWCADKLSVQSYQFYNEERAHFAERKAWLENPQSKLLGTTKFRYGNRDVIIHETLGLDKRSEAIFSVCYTNFRGTKCVLDYAIEDDILVRVTYITQKVSVTDAVLQEYIVTVEALWESWQSDI